MPVFLFFNVTNTFEWRLVETAEKEVTDMSKLTPGSLLVVHAGVLVEACKIKNSS